MSQGRQSICPVCGNYRQNGICLRCNANASSRAKRWRRGDRGGVRPERRKYNRRNVKKKQGTQSASTASRKKKRRVKTTTTPDDSIFYLALQGEWYSDQEKIKINIDLTRNRWTFSRATGKRLTQIWRLKYSSLEELHFARKGKIIIVRIGDGGVLMMTGRDRPVPFVNVKSGKKYRLCGRCYAKSVWRHNQCEWCGCSF